MTSILHDNCFFFFGGIPKPLHLVVFLKITYNLNRDSIPLSDVLWTLDHWQDCILKMNHNSIFVFGVWLQKGPAVATILPRTLAPTDPQLVPQLLPSFERWYSSFPGHLSLVHFSGVWGGTEGAGSISLELSCTATTLIHFSIEAVASVYLRRITVVFIFFLQ